MRNVQLPPRLLRTPEAVRFVGLSARTMEKHRIYGTGPTTASSGAEWSTRSRIFRPGATRA